MIHCNGYCDYWATRLMNLKKGFNIYNSIQNDKRATGQVRQNRETRHKQKTREGGVGGAGMYSGRPPT